MQKHYANKLFYFSNCIIASLLVLYFLNYYTTFSKKNFFYVVINNSSLNFISNYELNFCNNMYGPIQIYNNNFCENTINKFSEDENIYSNKSISHQIMNNIEKRLEKKNFRVIKNNFAYIKFESTPSFYSIALNDVFSKQFSYDKDLRITLEDIKNQIVPLIDEEIIKFFKNNLHNNELDFSKNNSLFDGREVDYHNLLTDDLIKIVLNEKYSSKKNLMRKFYGILEGLINNSLEDLNLITFNKSDKKLLKEYGDYLHNLKLNNKNINYIIKKIVIKFYSVLREDPKFFYDLYFFNK